MFNTNRAMQRKSKTICAGCFHPTPHTHTHTQNLQGRHASSASVCQSTMLVCTPWARNLEELRNLETIGCPILRFC